METVEKKIIKTTCPLPMEVLKEYFQDKENTSFLIDYRGGKLDANALMIYLSNLNLDADFDKETYEDRDSLKELVVAYMKTTTALLDNEQLAREALAICCQHRGILAPEAFIEEGEEYEENCDDPDAIFKYYELLENADDFIEENLEMVERWCSMLDSSSVYNLHVMNDPTFNEFIEAEFEEIDDPDWVGINYVNLFALDWIGYYIGYPEIEDKRKPRYFVNQFNEYRFKGKNMMHYFDTESNTLSVMSQVIASGTWEEGLDEELMQYPEGYNASEFLGELK